MKVGIPGFIDLQVNGFKGTDFSDPELTVEEFTKACRALLDRGTAAFLPTLITSAKEVYERNLPLIAEVLEEDEFKGRLLGIHLEGPFISDQPGAVGAHNKEWVNQPDVEMLNELAALCRGHLRLLTLACELEGALDLTESAIGRGMTVSNGHSMAIEEHLSGFFDAGGSALTHLGNGLPNILPRHENPIWAGLANDQLAAMIITDGHHLPSSVIKTFIRSKGVDNIIVVSDASSIAGLPPGRYQALGNEVNLEECGRIYNPVKQCLVGSSATVLDCMNNLATMDILTLEELLRTGFYNPLELIGVSVDEIPRNGFELAFDEKESVFSISSEGKEIAQESVGLS